MPRSCFRVNETFYLRHNHIYNFLQFADCAFKRYRRFKQARRHVCWKNILNRNRSRTAGGKNWSSTSFHNKICSIIALAQVIYAYNQHGKKSKVCVVYFRPRSRTSELLTESELHDKICAGSVNSWQTSLNFSYNSLSAAIHLYMIRPLVSTNWHKINSFEVHLLIISEAFCRCHHIHKSYITAS